MRRNVKTISPKNGANDMTHKNSVSATVYASDVQIASVLAAIESAGSKITSALRDGAVWKVQIASNIAESVSSLLGYHCAARIMPRGVAMVAEHCATVGNVAIVDGDSVLYTEFEV